MTPPAYKYFAFISYSRKDSKAAAWLQKRLEWFRFPVKLVPEERRPPNSKYVRPVYRDKTNLEVTDEHYWKNIRKALEESRFLIVLCSPHSAKSEPVDMEVTHFLENHEHDTSLVVPVIVSGNVTSVGDDAALCPALRALGSTLINRNLPTLVPDAVTAEQDAMEAGFVSLVSYLLNLKRTALGDHIQRETKRQAHVLRYWLAAVTLLTLCAVAGFLYALTQQRRAEAETARAEENAEKLKIEEAESKNRLLEQSRSDHASALRILPGRGYAEALAHFERALTLAPHNANALLGSAAAVFSHDLPSWATVRVPELEGEPSTVSFSADGKRCVLFTTKELQVFDTSTWEPVLTVKTKNRLNACQITPDGNQCVLAGGYDAPLEILEVSTGKISPLATDERIISSPQTIAISPDGRSFACGFYDGSTRIISLSDGNTRKLPFQVERYASCITYSPDGSLLALGASKTMLVLDASSGRELSRATCKGLISALCFSPDGHTFLVGCRSGEFHQFSAVDWKETGTNQFARGITSMAFSPDMDLLGIGCVVDDQSGRLPLFPTNESETEAGELLFQTPIRSLQFCPDGKWLVASCADHVRILQPLPALESGSLGFDAVETRMETKQALHITALEPSGLSTSLLSMEGKPHFWQRSLDSDSFHGNPVFSLASNTFAIWRKDMVELSRASDGTLLHTIPLNAHSMVMTFSPDGAYLVIGTGSKDFQNGQVQVYETASGSLRHDWKQPSSVLRIFISPDSSQLVVGTIDQTLKVLEMASGKVLMQKKMPMSPSSFSFSPDGALLAVGASELMRRGAATVLDVATGKVILNADFPSMTHAVLLHSEPLVLSVAFSSELFGPSQLVTMDVLSSEKIFSQSFPGRVSQQREMHPTGSGWISISYSRVRGGETRVVDSHWWDRPGEVAASWWRDLLRSRSGQTLAQGITQNLSGQEITQSMRNLWAAHAQAADASWQTSILRWWLSPAEKRSISPWSQERCLDAISHQFRASEASPEFLRRLCKKAPWHPLQPLSMARLYQKPDNKTDDATRKELFVRFSYLAHLTLKRLREADEKLYSRDTLAEYAAWAAKITHEELHLDAEAKEAIAFALERTPPEKQKELLELKTQLAP